MAQIDYFNDNRQWGNYQYVTIEEVINNFLMSMDQDDYPSNTPRHKLLFHAKRGVRELYFDIMREVKGIELDLSMNLSVTLPPDYVDYVRISWVDQNGQLHKMSENKVQSIAVAYLQDHDYQLLFDDSGCVLQGTGRRDRSMLDEDNPEDRDPHRLSRDNFTGASYCRTFNPNTNFSNVYLDGSYRVDTDRGIIEFSSDVFARSIVLEYISDGLYIDSCEGTSEETLRIHKFAEQALIDYIYYRLIKQRRNVPAVAKQLARKDFYNSKRRAKRRLSMANRAEFLQAFKGGTTWVKDPNLNNPSIRNVN